MRKRFLMRERIEKVLDEIRAILKVDGIDIELIQITEDGVVQVHLRGACATCTDSIMTLKQGIERFVMEQIPEVRKVITV
jgi:Fe-S cluster biogenesis protein NfuA